MLTHFHGDHIGAAAAIAGWGEAEVLACHGEPLTHDAAAALEAAARSLPADTDQHARDTLRNRP